MDNQILLGEKFRIINKLGKGGFGIVYKVLDIHTGSHYAVKMEKIQKGKFQTLEKEIQIIRQLKGTEGVFNIYDSGKQYSFCWVVIDLLGHSIGNVFMKYKQLNQKFNLTTLLKIGVQMISRLESLHKKGYVHRDVKPQNFVFGLTNQKFVYLVDFGLCQLFINPLTKKQLAMTMNNPFVGTPYFASKSAHLGYSQYRRDDLQSVCYVLIYLMRGFLPWTSVTKQELCQSAAQKIGQIKCEMTNKMLCSGFSERFEMFVNNIFQLGIWATPDYELLKSQLMMIDSDVGQKHMEINQEFGKPKNKLTDLFKNKLK